MNWTSGSHVSENWIRLGMVNVPSSVRRICSADVSITDRLSARSGDAIGCLRGLAEAQAGEGQREVAATCAVIVRPARRRVNGGGSNVGQKGSTTRKLSSSSQASSGHPRCTDDASPLRLIPNAHTNAPTLTVAEKNSDAMVR
jgi:hypothetical protein